MISKLNPWLVIILLGFVFQSKASAEQKLALEWLHQISSPQRDYDIGYGVSTDQLGNVFISGWTAGTLGDANYGSSDAFVSKYDSNGNLAWTQQLGTSTGDESFAVSADNFGNVYISGNTGGNLSGLRSDGSADVFLSKYDDNGTLLWTRQFGSSQYDRGEDLTTDKFGNTYITGYTLGSIDGVKQPTSDVDNDAYVTKYSSNGTHLWTKQFGTDKTDRGFGVSADDSGNVYVSGHTFGDLGGDNSGRADTFVRKLDSDGSEIWTKQLGTRDHDYNTSIALDSLGNVFISGYTEGDLEGVGAGDEDAFLSKYDANGTLLWTRQLGTEEDERSYSVATDLLGNAYISGYTEGALGNSTTSRTDAFVSKYDESGNLIWTSQFGTNYNDWSRGISVDAHGNLFLTGHTDGNFNFNGLQASFSDIFVAKFSQPIPEPSTLFLYLSGFLLLLSSRWNSSETQ